MNEQDLVERAAEMLRRGTPEQEVEAWMQAQLQPDAPAARTPKLPAAAPVDRLNQKIQNPEGQDPLVKYGIPALGFVGPVGVGAGVGGLAARALAKRLGTSALGRVASGAISGTLGGAATRKVAGGDVVGPWMGLDALSGGVFGSLSGVTPAASKRAAHEISESIPRVARKGVPAEIAEVAGIAVQEPGVVQSGMGRALSNADKQRFAFLNQSGGGVVSDPVLLAKYRQIQESFPELDGFVDAKTAIKRANNQPFHIGSADQPTLQRLHYVKQLLRKPEQLAQTRAASARPLGREDLADIRQLGSDFRQALSDFSPAYKSATAASSADRIAISAVEQGKKVAKSSSRSGGRNPTSPATVAEETAALQPGPQTEAYRQGFVGELSLTNNPLDAVRGPGAGPVRDKMRALLGNNAVREIDQRVNPWENAAELGGKLGGGGLDLATRFGASGALGGNVQAARTALGAQALNALMRGSRLKKVEKMVPLFRKMAPGPDTEDIVRLLAELNKVKQRRSVLFGGVAGGAAGARAPWERRP